MVDLINRVSIAMWTRLRRDEGQTMVEYGLILALIAAVAVGTVTLLGGNVNDAFTYIKDKLVTPSS